MAVIKKNRKYGLHHIKFLTALLLIIILINPGHCQNKTINNTTNSTNGTITTKKEEKKCTPYVESLLNYFKRIAWMV